MSYDLDQETPHAQRPSTRQSATFSEFHSMSNNTLPDPFSATAGVAFFSGGERRVLLDEVIHLCQFGNNLVAVLGESGVGKSTFLYQARYELSDAAFCCSITAEPTVSAEVIFSQINTQLDLPLNPGASVGEMIATLRHGLAEGNLNRVVIVIDDAHLLSDQILAALASLLQGHQGNHLHILLGGDASLADRLDQFEMVDVLVYDITLNPLSLDATKAYVEFKMSTAGYKDADGLSDTEVQALWRETEGYPGAVNQVAQRLLFQQDMGEDGNEVKAPGLPLLHMFLLVLLLAALIMALFYLGEDEQSDKTGKTTAKVTVLGIPPVTKVDAPVAQEAVEVQVPQPVAESLSTQETMVVVGNTELTETAKPAVPAVPVPSEPVAEVASIKSDPEPLASKLGEAELKALPQPLKEELAKEAATLSIAKNTALSEAKSVPKASTYSPDVRQVMAWPDDKFALQILAAGQEIGLRQFIAEQPNRDDLRLIGVLRNGKPWYVVVAGVYDDSDSARRAIQSLPQKQVNSGPWPRKVIDLKREIEAFRSN